MKSENFNCENDKSNENDESDESEVRSNKSVT